MTGQCIFGDVKYVSTTMDISIPSAYKIIKKLNGELESKGYLVVRGKVNREYFHEKIYGKAS